MKIELNYRTGGWWKSLLICVVLLVLGIFGTVFGLLDGDPLIVGIFALDTVLFAFIVFALLNPRMQNCMQVVKDDMSYKELRAAIAREDFEQPLHSLQGTKGSDLLLLSDEWMVLGTSENPVCIPKVRVTSIKLVVEPVNYFSFTCDNKHSFHSGLVSSRELNRAVRLIKEHFPKINIETVRSLKE